MRILPSLVGLCILLAACGAGSGAPASQAPVSHAAGPSTPSAGAAAASGQQSQPSSQSWDDVLAAAKREGKVRVIVPPGDDFRAAATQFSSAYPSIQLSLTSEHIRDALPRIERERQGGIYSADLMVGAIGADVFQQWIPHGVLDPLPPVLRLPEASDDSKWDNGFADGWMDAGKTYVYGFIGNHNSQAFVNRDLVSEQDVPNPARPEDLLNPKWKGKIVWDDPRELGQGVNLATAMFKAQGGDYLKNLLTQQQPVLSRDLRQEAEWVVRGTNPIGLAVEAQQIGAF
ncbi:MAG TPA: ABC transporter substrate-binding protein, partial [Chloroflexota bacterium]|nr:ABC transporter substrate-binding protein [Chloroflexota bacterium]